VKDGALDVEMTEDEAHNTITIMADAMAKMLGDADNYIEFVATPGKLSKLRGSYVITVGRGGRPTPHELRVQAENERDDAREEATELEGKLTDLCYSLATEDEIGEWTSHNDIADRLIDHIGGKIQRLERQVEKLTAERNAAQDIMNEHRCDEQAERAYRKTIQDQDRLSKLAIKGVRLLRAAEEYLTNGSSGVRCGVCMGHSPEWDGHSKDCRKGDLLQAIEDYNRPVE